MQQKQNKILILIALVIGGGFWYFSGSDEVERQVPAAEAEVAQVSPPPVEVAPDVAPVKKSEIAKGDGRAVMQEPQAEVSTAPAPRNFAPLDSVIPASEKLRAEVAANPHGSPESFLQFAAELGERMEAAQASEERAKSFFPELDSCVRDPRQKGRHTVQALCLVNARRLAETYPSLKGEFDSLKQSAEPSTVALSNRIK